MRIPIYNIIYTIAYDVHACINYTFPALYQRHLFKPNFRLLVVQSLRLRETDRQTDRQRERQRQRDRDRQRQIDRHTDRDRDRQRETYR